MTILDIKPFEPLTENEALEISKETGFDIGIIKTRFNYYNQENYLVQYVGDTREYFISIFKVWFKQSIGLS